MRVCDLTTLYTEGVESGVNTYLFEKARYFAGRDGDTHVIVVPGRAETRSRLFDSTLYTVKSPVLPWNKDHRVLRNHGAVRAILRREEPTVVEVDCAYTLGRVAASALNGRRVPVLGFYHVHLPTFIARPGAARFGGAMGTLTERLAWKYTRYCTRHCNRLVVSSPDIRARLERAGLTRLDYVPLGVNLELFRPQASNGAPREGGPATLLYVGRLSYEKDLEVLLEAFALLSERGEYRLRIVGDGPLRGALQRKAGSDAGVSFLGFQPYGEELARIYASADVLVSASPNETFSLSIVEAFASGIPVVAARSGGPIDLVPPQLGALAEPGDAADFARKVEDVLAKPAPPAECRRHVEQNYSWSKSFERLQAVYERAIDEA